MEQQAEAGSANREGMNGQAAKADVKGVLAQARQAIQQPAKRQWNLHAALLAWRA
ncbi:hypothetical protein [Sandaracinobacteroides saxicola]|uniref:Uncharacterized protein n=1 Tax=Sandaracinobacteroides saxicola TaxID=2759707 RepID=A0A7G5IFG8_9SPHN|nr:hypothetical protein [Sandaracinobacteroides saxicola]QMW22110.1 hypothetical protein H3309_12125 [Sandaracinobacteroides saxicola]